jgi:RNA polymerase sigma-70 factor, ECF subfamily
LVKVKTLEETNDLIQKFKEGNQDTFRKVYEFYYPQLYLFARRFVDREDARDSISKVFVKLWDCKTELGSIKDIHSYLRKAVKNTCFDKIKSNKYSHDLQNKLAAEFHQKQQQDFELSQLKADVYLRIREEIAKLSNQEKKIFELAYWQGLRNKEIAALLGTSEGTVRNQRSAALAKLRSAFKNKPLYILILTFMNH